jgi:predicted DNA-binding transcriptional regulator AlpA
MSAQPSPISRPRFAQPIGEVPRSSVSDRALISEILRSYRRAITARELAEILHLHPVTVYRKAKAHIIPCRFIGAAVRFDPGAIARWWEESHS